VDSKLSLSRAIVVEGRDDVDAVSRAADALIIPTHGYGITAETWAVIAKAYEEKGLVILTDPDHAGEQIRRKLTEKFPDAVQAYIARSDATRADDIGVENASPEVIREALEKALSHLSHLSHTGVTMADLTELGLAGSEGASELRAAVCRELGIGYGNAGAMVKKLRGFGIDTDELREAVKKVKKQTR
jgi:ribonuclease M5